MDNLIEVLRSIFKENFILKDEQSRIIHPTDNISKKHFTELDHNQKDIFNTRFDPKSQKFLEKITKKITYKDNNYTLIIYNDKTKEVTDYKDREFELYIDNLTNIYRREMTYIKADEYIEHAIKKKESFAIVIIDIDNFKNINDTYGHLSGDKTLKFIAKELFYGTRHRKDNDIIGRIGGDEFFILLKNIKEKDIIERLNQLNQNIINDLYQKKFKAKITCSFGAYYINSNELINVKNINEFREKLYDKADKALYISKRGGKNLITIHNKNTKLN